MNDDLNILEEINNTKKEEVKKIDKETFLTLPRPDIYKPFDNIFNILNKKMLIDSKEDIKVWEDDLEKKIVNCVQNVDDFLSKVLEAKAEISISLKRYYYEGKIKEILQMEVQSYMQSELWEQEEMFKDEDKRFPYTNYVSDKYCVYQALTKKGGNRFILILILCFEGIKEQLVFKKKDLSSNYYLLDLTEEYLEFVNQNKS